MKGDRLNCDGQNGNNLLHLLAKSQLYAPYSTPAKRRVRKGKDMHKDAKSPPGGEEKLLAAMNEKLDGLAEMLERVQARLDALYDECQRAAGGGQRMLLRQQSLAESLARVEALLSARERADFTQSQTP